MLLIGSLNLESVKEIVAYTEVAIDDLSTKSRRQFERLGDFVTDCKKRQQGKSVFNRAVMLKNSWQSRR